eukprot:gene14590-4309_t
MGLTAQSTNKAPRAYTPQFFIKSLLPMLSRMRMLILIGLIVMAAASGDDHSDHGDHGDEHHPASETATDLLIENADKNADGKLDVGELN